MPLRDYFLLDGDGKPTKQTVEVLIKNPPPKELTLDDGRKAVLKEVSVPARMNVSWAGSAGTLYGVNGRLDRGLGVRVDSPHQAEKIAESKGLIPLSNFGKHFLDDAQEAQTAREEAEDRAIEAFDESNKQFRELV